MHNTRVLVTGGAGFIGSHLVKRLVAMHSQVTVLDNLVTGELARLQSVLPEIQLVVGDLGDLIRSRQLQPEQYTHIFHLAANSYIPPSVENPAFDFFANAYNTFFLLEAMRTCERPPRLINTSSAAVYGNPVRFPIKEDDTLAPISPYGVSKLAGERYAAVYSQLYGIQTTSLRLFSVYGPGQRKQVVYDLLRRLYANPARLEIIGDGSQARDFCFVSDVVESMLLAAEHAPGNGEVYNVASGVTHSITNLVALLTEICNVQPTLVWGKNLRPGDAERWVVDISAIQQLGYAPRVVLREGLIRVRDWYSQNERMTNTP